jgi:hypothetical protein
MLMSRIGKLMMRVFESAEYRQAIGNAKPKDRECRVG